MPISLSEVFNALGTDRPETPGQIVFGGVSTDTRTLKPGDLYVALTGVKDDGHHYIAQAIKAGAAGLVVSQNVVASRDIPTIRVPDTTVAYGLLARRWRDKFEIPIVAVTGSVGKTTTKEMLAAALSPLGLILKTQASQNNETGVPKTLLQLTPEHRAAVIEMGMRGSGQIAELCAIARPTVGVITLIAENHIELLGSLEAIADAKGELCAALSSDAVAILNADDTYFSRLSAKTSARVIAFGLSENAEVRATDIQRTQEGWQFSVGETTVQIHSPSRHDISNALAAYAVAQTLGIAPREIAEALGKYTPPPMRMQIEQLSNWGGTILNDAYNAAPASVRSALETLAAYEGGRKIAFLGDMRELGDFALDAHTELGATITQLGGLDALYTVGDLAQRIPDATQHFTDSKAASEFAENFLKLESGDIILVKGSRAMAMELIVEALRARSIETNSL